MPFAQDVPNGILRKVLTALLQQPFLGFLQSGLRDSSSEVLTTLALGSQMLDPHLIRQSNVLAGDLGIESWTLWPSFWALDFLTHELRKKLSHFRWNSTAASQTEDQRRSAREIPQMKFKQRLEPWVAEVDERSWHVSQWAVPL